MSTSNPATPAKASRPPVAPRRDDSFTHLGRTFEDPYTWLQNRDDPAVLEWIQAENAYAREHLAPLRPLQETLYSEMLRRVREDDETVPVQDGPYLYFARISKGDQYRRLYRRARPTATNPAPQDELLLDENAMAQGLKYCRIRRAIPSPDHSKLAWLVDTTGAWVYDLYVKDLATGQILAGPIAETAYAATWAADNNTLFFTRFDHAHRAAEVLRLDLASGSEPVPVYREDDEAFHLDIGTTRSGGYIVVTAVSGTTSEVHTLRADQPRGTFTVVEPREHGHEYYVEHAPDAHDPYGGHFLIHTNDAGSNFRLVQAPVGSPGRAEWAELLPHRPDTLLEEVHAFRTFVAIAERSGGLQHLRILSPGGELHSMVPFPEEVYTVSLGETQFFSGFDQNPDFNSPTLRLFYSSLVTPYSTIDFDIATRTWQVRKVQNPDGYDAQQYETHRLHATSHDGTQVPLSIVHRRDMPRDGDRPVFLYGYGAYGYSSDPDFDNRYISLLDRGFVVAITHVRGGNELGREWYEAGRLTHKANTFHDFIACAEALIAAGYTRPGRIAATGGSAGGLLVTVATNWRPELWGAVVARVPYTNVITAMRMPELPLTINEWEQWGNPEIPEQFDAMFAYSPYDNIRPQRYPPLLVTAGLNDLQVPYWDPAKYVAKLRNTETGDAPILLLTNMGAGHSGSSGRYAKMREDAELYAFILAMLGLDQAPTHGPNPETDHNATPKQLP